MNECNYKLCEHEYFNNLLTSHRVVIKKMFSCHRRTCEFVYLFAYPLNVLFFMSFCVCFFLRFIIINVIINTDFRRVKPLESGLVNACSHSFNHWVSESKDKEA